MRSGPISVHSLFPIPVAVYEYEPTVDIVNFLNNVKMSTTNSQELVSQYGSISEDTYLFDNPILKPLVDVIIKESTKFVIEYLGYDNIQGMQITQSWISHKSPGQFHSMHTHANSVVSGVFYFDGVPVDQPIVFHNTTAAHNINTMDVPAKGPFQASFFVNKNNIVMFPSYLTHSVPMNNSSSVRKSLAFNVIPTRSWGNSKTLNELIFSRLI